MKIIDNRALEFSYEFPERITATIKKSAILPNGNVLVHWNARTVQELVRLGIKGVPSAMQKNYPYPGKDKPRAHQKVMAEFMAMNKRCFNFGEMGCVDSETEYLSPTGWVKLSEYVGGDVAQYWPDSGSVDFVPPIEYIKLPCAEMLHIKTKYGIDQMLSLEHRVLLHAKGTDEKREVLSAEALLERHDNWVDRKPWVIDGACKKGTKKVAYSKAAIPCTFSVESKTCLAISDAALRVQVAVIADGYFPNKNDKCIIRIKKVRKQNRLRQILAEADIQYTARPCLPDGFLTFKFDAPIKTKVFGVEFWAASYAQRVVIADEVLHWDGSVVRGQSFSSSKKESADFIQYVFASIGKAARVTPHVRFRRGRTETDYDVTIRPNGEPLMLCSVSSIGERRKVMGIVPATDGFKYCFSVPSTFLLFRRNGCIFASGNTGKSRSTLWAIDYLMSAGMVKRALIVAPLSILRCAWESDLFCTAMTRTVGIAVGEAKKRKMIISSDCEICIINHDGLTSSLKDLKAAEFDLIVIDECTSVQNTMTHRWKALNSLVKPDTYLWMLTGTPAANSPLQAYGLAKLVQPDSVPRFFTGWKDKTMNKLSMFTFVPKITAKDEVYRALQPAIRFAKKDCVELPPITYMEREFEMDAVQAKYYKEMKSQLLMFAAQRQITAVNSGVLMGKLLQIASGAVYSDDGSIIDFKANRRLQEMTDVINECGEKVLVFAQYRHTIRLISEHLQAAGIDCATIDGDTSQADRKLYIDKFQNTPELKVLVLQPKVTAHGITLTAASTIVWFTPVSSLETWLQANARIDRIGQVNKMSVVKLIGSPIERKVYKVLETRGAAQTDLLELYREELTL
ncbi:MAG: DEAD/DEAH box helicase [Minisyncoccota bacterium]